MKKLLHYLLCIMLVLSTASVAFTAVADTGTTSQISKENILYPAENTGDFDFSTLTRNIYYSSVGSGISAREDYYSLQVGKNSLTLSPENMEGVTDSGTNSFVVNTLFEYPDEYYTQTSKLVFKALGTTTLDYRIFLPMFVADDGNYYGIIMGDFNWNTGIGFRTVNLLPGNKCAVSSSFPANNVSLANNNVKTMLTDAENTVHPEADFICEITYNYSEDDYTECVGATFKCYSSINPDKICTYTLTKETFTKVKINRLYPTFFIFNQPAKNPAYNLIRSSNPDSNFEIYADYKTYEKDSIVEFVNAHPVLIDVKNDKDSGTFDISNYTERETEISQAVAAFAALPQNVQDAVKKNGYYDTELENLPLAIETAEFRALNIVNKDSVYSVNSSNYGAVKAEVTAAEKLYAGLSEAAKAAVASEYAVLSARAKRVDVYEKGGYECDFSSIVETLENIEITRTDDSIFKDPIASTQETHQSDTEYVQKDTIGTTYNTATLTNGALKLETNSSVSSNDYISGKQIVYFTDCAYTNSDDTKSTVSAVQTKYKFTSGVIGKRLAVITRLSKQLNHASGNETQSFVMVEYTPQYDSVTNEIYASELRINYVDMLIDTNNATIKWGDENKQRFILGSLAEDGETWIGSDITVTIDNFEYVEAGNDIGKLYNFTATVEDSYGTSISKRASGTKVANFAGLQRVAIQDQCIVGVQVKAGTGVTSAVAFGVEFSNVKFEYFSNELAKPTARGATMYKNAELDKQTLAFRFEMDNSFAAPNGYTVDAYGAVVMPKKKLASAGDIISVDYKNADGSVVSANVYQESSSLPNKFTVNILKTSVAGEGAANLSGVAFECRAYIKYTNTNTKYSYYVYAVNDSTATGMNDVTTATSGQCSNSLMGCAKNILKFYSRYGAEYGYNAADKLFTNAESDYSVGDYLTIWTGTTTIDQRNEIVDYLTKNSGNIENAQKNYAATNS